MDVDVAILGAGLAAGAAIEPLRAAGLTLAVLDKSRGVGGRTATRRIDGIPVDHGAQFFTVRSADFAETVRRWISEGTCFEWCSGFHRFEDGAVSSPRDDEIHSRYACPRGMTSLAKDCFRSVNVLHDHLVTSIRMDANDFLTECENGQIIRSKAILSTLPFPQGQKLLGSFFDEPNRFALEFIRVDPCLAAIVELKGASPEWKGIQTSQDDVLTWLGADFSKRTPAPPRRFVVLHGSSAFSQEHLEGDLSAAGRLMLERAGRICPTLREADLVQVHRWRYAKVSQPLSDIPYWRFLNSAPLYMAGDAFGRGNVESAWLSGATAGVQLARELQSAGAVRLGTTRRGSDSPSTQ
jgi:predicted NAD/FAD-dependent oxidoreductase